MDYVSDTQSGYEHKEVVSDRKWGPSARSSVDITADPTLTQQEHPPTNNEHCEGELKHSEKDVKDGKTDDLIKIPVLVIYDYENHPEINQENATPLDEVSENKHSDQETAGTANCQPGDQITNPDASMKIPEQKESASLRRVLSVKSNIAYCTEDLDEVQGITGVHSTDSHPNASGWDPAPTSAPSKNEKKGLIKYWRRFKENFHLGKSASNH